MVSTSLHFSNSNFRRNQDTFRILRPSRLVDDGDCYHSGNGWVQFSHKLP